MTPTILYKYRDDSVRTEEIITNRKVWLAKSATLNDPVECRTGVIPEDWKRRTIRQMEEAQLMGLFGMPPKVPKTLFSYDRARTKKWLRRLKKLDFDGKVRELHALFLEHGQRLSNPRDLFTTLADQLANVGIFSLSDCPDNQPMWAHYASNHSGLALGFSVAEGSKLANAEHTIPVNYLTERPVFKTRFLQQIAFYNTSSGIESKAKFAFNDPVFRASITTKPPGWSYEREWRYVEDVGGLYDFPGPLSSVIFGLRMPLDRRDHYRKLIDPHNGVRLYEVIVSDQGNFEVTSYV
jgi:Protein of unknown function (DUF2971)